MFIILIVTVILLLVLIISLKIGTKSPDIPLYSGAWPIIGHIPLIYGDNIKLYETICKISKASNQNGRPIGISLGVVKYYYVCSRLGETEVSRISDILKYNDTEIISNISLGSNLLDIESILATLRQYRGASSLYQRLRYLFMEPKLVFTDPDDCYAILNSSVEKLETYSFAKPWLGDGLFTASPQKWHTSKKLLYPMFQQQNLNKFLIVFNKESRHLVEMFSEQVGKGGFNHEPNVLHTSLASICQTAMGSKEGQLTLRNEKVVNAIKGAMDSILARLLRVWLHPQLIYNASSTKRELDKHVKIITEFADQMLQQRKSKLKPGYNVEDNVTVSEDYTPFVDTIIKIAQGEKEFTDRDVMDEVNTLILTGYDTVANTLVFALMLLGHHQDVQEKVYQELVEVVGDTDRDLDKYDLIKLVYLEATIKEVMRLYTVAPLIARNACNDVKLRNCTVPAGTDCLISLYGIHRHPGWGFDAEVFNPERWMNPETTPKNPNLYAPFGMGKRNCVGKTYAMMSMKTTLAHVVRNYRIKSDIDKLVIQMMLLIKPASGHLISLESRIKIG